MWKLLPLLAAIALAYIAIRRVRLVQERRERAQDIASVEAVFVQASQAFSLGVAGELVKAIRGGKRIRLRLLNPELKRLEAALERTSQWSYEIDPEIERKAVLNGVAQLYVKWRDIRGSL